MVCAQLMTGGALQPRINIAQNIIGTHLPSISDTGETRCPCRAQRILKDDPNPNNSLFTLLPYLQITEQLLSSTPPHPPHCTINKLHGTFCNAGFAHYHTAAFLHYPYSPYKPKSCTIIYKLSISSNQYNF